MSKLATGKKTLSGVKVLEVCQMVAGPFCARLMADMGAEVIKIEPPKLGDAARRREPFLGGQPHPERSGLFLCVNTGKLGITLDLETQTGKNIFESLVKSADILIEDKSPDEAVALGLGFEELSAINPKLIVTSITPFGKTGPYRNYKAYPLNTFHAGSEGYLTPGIARPEFATRPPLKAGTYVGEYESAVSSSIATMAALFWQRASGQGQHIDISKQEALVYLNQTDIFPYPLWGLVASRSTRVMSFGGIIECKDGHIQLGLYEEHQWHALVRLMGNPDWAAQEKFQDYKSRARHGTELNGLISQWAKNHNKQELYHSGQAVGVPLAPYNTTKEVVESRQLAARDFFVEITHPVAGTFKYPTVPFRFSKSPHTSGIPAPCLGQHNREILCGRLGYDEAELAKLAEAGVI